MNWRGQASSCRGLSAHAELPAAQQLKGFTPQGVCSLSVPKLPIICTLAAKCDQIYSDIFKRIKKTFHKIFVAIGPAVN